MGLPIHDGSDKNSLTILGKSFQGLSIEMLIRTLPTTPLQIPCKIILNFQDIGQSMRDSDNTSILL